MQDKLVTERGWLRSNITVITNSDATKDYIIDRIRSLPKGNTTSLYYHAGHGGPDGTRCYEGTHISPAELENEFGSSYNNYLALIDACGSGIFPDRMSHGVVASACRSDQNAIDSPTLGHAVFTYYFMEGLASHLDYSAEQVCEYAKTATEDRTLLQDGSSYMNPVIKDNYPGALDLKNHVRLVPNNFTLQSAISASSAGDVVKITQSISISTPITVNSGVTVKVEPGVTLSFGANCSLTVNGILNASGAAFTGSNWEGIIFNSAEGSILTNNCTIQYANAPITINSTSNITISGCTISNSSFSAGAAILISGSSSWPVITNTDINGQTNSNNGMRFVDNSHGIVDNCWVRNCGNGNGIVIESGACPTVQNTFIFNNKYHGILSISGGSATFQGNIIQNNGIVNAVKTYDGIHLFNAGTSWIMGNTISGSNAGVYCDGANPTAFYRGGAAGSGGKNAISGNNYGIYASSFSNPVMGQVFGPDDTEGTCNKIFGNSVNSIYNSASVVTAERNWWGQPGGPTDVINYSGGTTSVEYPLASEYEADTFVPKTGTVSERVPSLMKSASMKELLVRAWQYVNGKRYAEAADLFNEVASKSTAQDEIIVALNGLQTIFEVMKESKYFNNLELLASGNSVKAQIASDYLMRMYSIAGKSLEMQMLYSTIQKQYPFTETEKHAYIQMLMSDRKNKKARTLQSEISDPIFNRYAKLIDDGILAALGLLTNGETRHAQLVEEEGLVNFPNPFNPTTTISYIIPQSGMVSLKVYDILGREVANLVNEYKTVGRYNVSFDAGSLPSGIYVYRIQSGNFTAVKKMQLLK